MAESLLLLGQENSGNSHTVSNTAYDVPGVNFTNKIVIALPLSTLWAEERELDFERQNHLDSEGLKELLRDGPVQFVIADVGQKLNWIPLNKCFEFYKSAVKDHIIECADNTELNSFNGEYGYLLSIWKNDLKKQVVLLEHVH